MTVAENGGPYSVVCDLCLRDDEEKTNLSEHLLVGLIEAVNELTDAVKTLTKKKKVYNLNTWSSQ